MPKVHTETQQLSLYQTHDYALTRIAESPLHALKRQKYVKRNASNQTRDTENTARERS